MRLCFAWACHRQPLNEEKSMHTARRLRLAFAAVVAASVPAQSAQAAEIEEIVILGNRLEETIPQDLARYGNRVEVITAERVEQGGFIDITQTLQMLVPGLHFRPKNGQFDYFEASLQASRHSEILWLIDGVRIINRLYNGTSPLNTVPGHMVERIEVPKRAGHLLWHPVSGRSGQYRDQAFSGGHPCGIGTTVNTNDGYGVNAYFRGGND
jgi:hypothetical protein